MSQPIQAKKVVAGKIVTKLTTIPQGSSIQQHILHLKERGTASESFASAMQHPTNILEGLDLDGRPMEVTDYATKNDCSIITDSLKKYDPCYSESYRSMHQLSKMPDIEEFIKSPDHCRRTEYTVEFRLCGKPNCDICKKVGRSVRTPNVTVNGQNLRNEMLRFTTLPVPNEDDPDHYLPSAEARKHIEDNNLSAEDLKKHLPTKLNTEEKKAVAEAKAKDKQHDFHATKVRATADCSLCGAVRVICSKNKVGSPGGPTEKNLEDLQRSLENNGYACGRKVKGVSKLFYSRRALMCGHPIEPQYYNPSTGTKGGRIVTKDLCSVCYLDEDLLSQDEIRNERDLGGKTPLIICRGCLEGGVDPPCSGARRNISQAKKQKAASKKRGRKAAEKSGRRKQRSN